MVSVTISSRCSSTRCWYENAPGTRVPGTERAVRAASAAVRVLAARERGKHRQGEQERISIIT